MFFAKIYRKIRKFQIKNFLNFLISEEDVREYRRAKAGTLKDHNASVRLTVRFAVRDDALWRPPSADKNGEEGSDEGWHPSNVRADGEGKSKASKDCRESLLQL